MILIFPPLLHLENNYVFTPPDVPIIPISVSIYIYIYIWYVVYDFVVQAVYEDKYVINQESFRKRERERERERETDRQTDRQTDKEAETKNLPQNYIQNYHNSLLRFNNWNNWK